MAARQLDTVSLRSHIDDVERAGAPAARTAKADGEVPAIVLKLLARFMRKGCNAGPVFIHFA